MLGKLLLETIFIALYVIPVVCPALVIQVHRFHSAIHPFRCLHNTLIRRGLIVVEVAWSTNISTMITFHLIVGDATWIRAGIQMSLAALVTLGIIAG